MPLFADAARFLARSASVVVLAGALTAQIEEFHIPTAGAEPRNIAAGPDGNVWFTEAQGNKLGRITPAGVITEFDVPTPASGPYGIAVGPDGRIWFTERFANQIGVFDPRTNAFVEYQIPTTDSQPWEIAAGADGKMWFVEMTGYKVASITPGGQITEFATPGCCYPSSITAGPGGQLWYTIETGDRIGLLRPRELAFLEFPLASTGAFPWDIAAGPDGNMWFSELNGRSLGRITPAGLITEFAIPGAFSGIVGIATGSDGNLYFTENDVSSISSMTSSGAILDTRLTSDRPGAACAGPDGNVWYVAVVANKIGRWEIARPGTEHVLSLDAGFSPTLRRADLGSHVQWMFQGPSVHSASDASGLRLFASGPREPVSFHEFRFTAAGLYIVKDEPTFPRGAIDVRVDVPSSGVVGIPFEVRWAEPQMPDGLVEDVLVLEPGAGQYTLVASSMESSMAFTPTLAGEYAFRARLRDPATGVACAYSRPAVVTVD